VLIRLSTEAPGRTFISQRAFVGRLAINPRARTHIDRDTDTAKPISRLAGHEGLVSVHYIVVIDSYTSTKSQRRRPNIVSDTRKFNRAVCRHSCTYHRQSGFFGCCRVRRLGTALSDGALKSRDLTTRHHVRKSLFELPRKDGSSQRHVRWRTSRKCQWRGSARLQRRRMGYIAGCWCQYAQAAIKRTNKIGLKEA